MMLAPKSTRFVDNPETVFNKTNGATPDTMDWRDVNNVVPPVKNQEQCGSCWAFSAVAAMEGAYNYKTGTLNEFSEQELVDCTKDGHYTCNLGGEVSQYSTNPPSLPPHRPTVYHLTTAITQPIHCPPPQMSDGIDYIASEQNGYIYTESAYPYTAKSCSIAKNCCTAEAGEGVATGITGHTAIPSGDEDSLKEASATLTVVSVGIDASAASFQLYSSGVYAPAGCSSTDLDHGVAVVGYNTMTKGGDYWIVRNSWGRTWGEQGYIYMARNDNNKCGIATDAATANI